MLCWSYPGLGFGLGWARGSDGHGFSGWVAVPTHLSCPGFSRDGGLVARSDGESSFGEVRFQTDWDLVWTGPNPAVPVPVWDFPKNAGPLGLRSVHSHLAQDRPDLVWTGTT